MTPTARPLPIEGLPFQDESLMGFVLRMSEVNHLNGIQWLRIILKKDRIFHLSMEQVPIISWIFGTPIEQLRNTSITFISEAHIRYWNFYSHFISKSYLIRHRTPQLCPKCIEENGFIKKIWDLSVVTCCPIHLVLLIEICEQCHKQITWNRPSVSHCSCGYDFRNSKTITKQQDECTLSQNFESKLIDRSLFVPATLKNPFSLLDTMSIDGAARMILTTGFLHDSSDLLAAGKSQKKISTQAMYEIGQRSILRLSKIANGDANRNICLEFLTSSLHNLEQDGITPHDRNLAWRLINLGRKGLPNRASLLNWNPRSQLELI